MAKRRPPGVFRAITNTTLSDVGRSISGLVYRVSRQHALAEVRREVGARVATLDAIAEKAYDQLGRTEVQNFPTNHAFSNQPKTNLDILAGLYETHPWVKICTSWIASALAGIPLRVVRSTGYVDGKETFDAADSNPVGSLFRWINPQQSPYSFVNELACWLLLCGEAYVAYATPGPSTPAGIPAEMYVMLTPGVEKITSVGGAVIGYAYRIGSEMAYFDASEVVYFKTYSPAGRFRGQGEAAAGIQTIKADQELRAFNRQVLTNGVHLSGVLETDNEDLRAEDAQAVREAFEKEYSGSAKAAKLAVLWGGLKFSPQTILQKDVMMAEQVIQHRDEIIALYGLKPELLTEKFANKATAETVRRMAYEDCVLGRWGAAIASAFNATGLRRFDPTLRVEWDKRNVPALQSSMKESVDSATAAVAGSIMTINEARDEFLELPPLDAVEADVLLFNGRPIDLSPQGQDAMPQAAGALGSDYVKADYVVVGDDRGRPATMLERRLALEASRAGKIDTKAAEEKLVYDRLRSASDARIERALRSVYREIAKEVRTLVTRSTVDAAMMAKIEQVFLHEGRAAVIRDFTPAIQKAIDDAVLLEIANLKIEGVFDIKPVRALKRLDYQNQRIRNMMGKRWYGLRAELHAGLAAGESQAKLIQRTSHFFDGMRSNAATIARTETTPAICGAAMDVAMQARQAGVDVVSIWTTAGDELVRQPPVSNRNHAQADGLTIVPGIEMFKISGESLEYPGDSWNGASPDNTINCRCGVRNQVRKIRGSDNRGES